MLSIYKLTQAINESSAGVVVADVPAYEFVGGLDEAASEMNYIVMTEAVDMASFMTVSEEIMTEAAISNPSTLETLSENVFKTAWENVKKFVDKLIAMVKGMIEKIKAHLFKMVGKTDKWISVMRPRLDAAKGKDMKFGEQVYNMYPWDAKYLASGGDMITGIANMASTVTSVANEKVSKMREAENALSTARSHLNKEWEKEGTAADAPGVGDASAELEKIAKASKDAAENNAKDFINTLASALKLTGTFNSTEDVWTAVHKKATGGGEKMDVKASNASEFFTAIENSKKTLEDLKTVYEKHANDLKKLKSDIDGIFKDDKSADKMPDAIKIKYREAATALSKQFIGEVSAFESAVGTAQTTHRNLVSSMTNDYMKAIAKWSNYSGTKEK